MSFTIDISQQRTAHLQRRATKPAMTAPDEYRGLAVAEFFNNLQHRDSWISQAALCNFAPDAVHQTLECSSFVL